MQSKYQEEIEKMSKKMEELTATLEEERVGLSLFLYLFQCCVTAIKGGSFTFSLPVPVLCNCY